MMYDIIIIGGGFSGLYAAYRLVSLNPKSKILLMDKQEELGGIIQTQMDNGFKMEYAAMRFKKSLHPKLFELFSNLNIGLWSMTKHEPYSDGYLSDDYSILPEEHKQIITEDRKISDPFGPALVLHFQAIKVILGDDFDWNIWCKYTQNKINKLLDEQKFNGTPLFQLSHQNLIKSVLSKESFAFLRKYAAHYLAFDDNINAIEGIKMFFEQLVSRNEEFVEVQKGGSEIIKRLTKYLRQLITIKLQANINDLIPLYNGVKVSFFDFKEKTQKTVTCKSVILAVNVSGLMSIGGLPLEVCNCLSYLVPAPAVKIFVSLEDFKNHKGCIQGSERIGEEVFCFQHSDSNKALVLFHIRNEYKSIKSILSGLHFISTFNKPSSSVEKFIEKKLQIYFPTYKSAKILHYVVIDWGAEPFKGVAFCAKAGHDLEEIINAVSNFSLSKNSSGTVHACCDSFSSSIGHLEGCIESVERVLNIISFGE